VHCCGDREQDWILESYKLAQDANPTYGLRHGIIHADIPTDWALEVMPDWQKTLDYGYTYTNPTFMWWTEIIANSMGPFMSLREMPMKTYLETGNLFGFGSDYNVDPMEPKYSIWAAITRDTLMGAYGPHPFGLDQCIGVRDSLRAMTQSNAYLLFMEDKIGSLEVGKYADIAVWDKDWYNATPDEIYNENCEMTLLGGKIVYKADTTPVTVATGL
jgi:predicted amidohydrolase YtcJ